MPLSENEQRILRQIEEQLQRDPGFARDLRPKSGPSRRSLVIAVVGTVLALGLCVFLLSVNPILAFVAFVAAVAALMAAERHLRSFGDEALRQMAARRGRTGDSA